METIEEKAKAYDEAIEREKAYHRNELAGSKREMIEYIFPELHESEEERMMREFNDWLCEEIEWRTNDVRDEKDRRTLNMLCYVLTKVKDWLEKQKEQKPAGWSEEDELMRTVIIQTLERFGGRGTTEMQIDWLKSLRPSWKPLKQQMDALHEAVIRSCSHRYGVELLSLEIDLLNLK